MCEQIGHPSEFTGVGNLLRTFQLHRSDLGGLLETAARLTHWGEVCGDARGRIIGHVSACDARWGRGEFVAAQSHIVQALALYQQSTDDPTAIWSYRVTMSGARLWSNAQFRLAHILCVLGWPARAMEHAAAIERHDEAEKPLVLEVAQDTWFRLRVELLLKDPADCVAIAEQTVKLSREGALPMLLAAAQILQAYVIARRGEPAIGRTIIADAFAAYRATEAVTWSCYYRALLAEAHQMLGETDAALHILGEALKETERTSESWYDSELHRRIGNVLADRGDRDAAKASYGRALAVARAQQAKLWELLAATSYARLLRDESKPVQAHSLLAPVYAWFTEGFDTVPLRAARAALDELDQACA